jgi:hypothetical protein
MSARLYAYSSSHAIDLTPTNRVTFGQVSTEARKIELHPYYLRSSNFRVCRIGTYGHAQHKIHAYDNVPNQ